MRQRLQARIDMLMENIALRHQLMVYERGRTARRSLSGNDRLLWCFLARFFSNWRDTLDIVQPATVTRWRRVRWGSVKSQGALGVASSERGRGAARDLSALSI